MVLCAAAPDTIQLRDGYAKAVPSFSNRSRLRKPSPPECRTNRKGAVTIRWTSLPD
ncbi:MAG: DUF3248 domain-containing protein [Acidobacteriota bacterium]|nr:DUF3248 domain-containing protein [Acidobacteriota bacterium]